MIFYDRADVWYGSLHVDPGAGWFPHYAGYADERGAGPGEGFTRNLPLRPGTGDDGWLAALDVLCARPGRWARRRWWCPRPGRGGGRPGKPAAGHRGRLPRGGAAARRLGCPAVFDPGRRLRPALPGRLRRRHLEGAAPR